MNETQIKSSMKDNRRKAIINAAFQIFVEKKIEPVSMGEIAEAAGVGRATLFRYYPNKLELVIAVCCQMERVSGCTGCETSAYIDRRYSGN